MFTTQMLTQALLLALSLVLTPVSAKLINLYDSEVNGDAPNSRHRRTIQGKSSRRWDQGIIPYAIHDDVTGQRRHEIYRAMYTYERFTCLRFVPMIVHADNTTTYDDYDPPLTQGFMRFIQSTGCWSMGCGKMGNAQGQRISCCACLHEIGHSLGFQHEQRSLDPSRKWMIRFPDRRLGASWGKYSPRENPSDALSLAGYMRKSYMHPAAFKDTPKKSVIDLYPDNRWSRKSIYYQMMEIDLAHDCAALRCSELTDTIRCENDGYLTEIDYTCQCQCVPGLDPSTGCTSVIKSTTPTQKFPGGSYALLRPNDGCSDDSQHSGSISSKQITGGKRNIGTSKSFDLSSSFRSPDMVQEFCVREESDAEAANKNEDIWPMGAYCIFRKGGKCPDRFTSGSVLYNGFNFTEATDVVPDYESDVDGPKLFYCCRNDTSFIGTHMNLPNRKPFALIRVMKNCEKVRGMHVYEQSYSVRKATHTNQYFGEKTGFNMVTTTVCYYKPAVIDCGEYIELSTDKRTVTFSSPVGKDLQCSWFIKAPKDQRLSLKFDSFDVPCSKGDSIDIRYFRPGQEGINFCTNSKTNYDMARTIQSINNTISIQLNTYGDSTSAFTATVTLILNEELCYNTEDHGVSYDGKVNFTRFFEPCLPWTEVSHCRYNAFKPHAGSESINAILEGNYCRNPDYETGIMPWCYHDADECKRNYCDPCQLGTVHDTAADCTTTVREGACGTGTDMLATGCAKSCSFDVPTFNLPQASTVACSPPPSKPSPDGELINNNDLATYPVGSKVTYQCSSDAGTRDSTCLTSGEWSPMGTVCDVCNPGWTFEADSKSCFKYFHDLVSRNEAKSACETYGGHLPTPRNVAETKVVWEIMWTNLRPHSVWLPMSDELVEGEWVWDGGEAAQWVTIAPWDGGQDDDEMADDVIDDDEAVIVQNLVGKRKDCAVVTSTGMWAPVRCQERYSYVCAMPRRDETDTCEDFFGGCKAALIAKPNMCVDEPEFALRMCRATCTLCGDRTERGV